MRYEKLWIVPFYSLGSRAFTRIRRTKWFPKPSADVFDPLKLQPANRTVALAVMVGVVLLQSPLYQPATSKIQSTAAQPGSAPLPNQRPPKSNLQRPNQDLHLYPTSGPARWPFSFTSFCWTAKRSAPLIRIGSDWPNQDLHLLCPTSKLQSTTLL